MRRAQLLGIALVIGLLAGAGYAQQTTGSAQTPPAQQTTPKPDAMGSGMMDQEHGKMMADMKAADEKLRQLVTKMNAATGDQKVSAMAEIVTQLVDEQLSMHQRMMQMMSGRTMPPMEKK